MTAQYSKNKATDTAETRWSHETALDKFRLYRETRDLGFRDEIVSEFLPLVYSAAQRYSNHGEPLDDLIQEGSIGLMRAVDYFDPTRGVKFSTYACHLITSHILHYLRDCGHLIRQPAWVQELNAKITRAAQELTGQLGRDPQPAEIARHLNLTEESVLEVLAARELNRVVSLTAPLDNNEDDALLLIDKEKIRQQKYESLELPIEDRIVLDDSIAHLKVLERKVLQLFFFAELSLTEIARKLSISIPRSSYLLRRSIDKIKTDLNEQRDHEAAVLKEVMPPFPPPENGMPIYDKVIGVHSEAFLRSRVDEEVRSAHHERTRFALVLLHDPRITGKDADEQCILGTLGRLLRRITHITDTTAYLGEGCFGMLLKHLDADVPSVCERLCRDICAQHAQEEPRARLTLNLNTGYAGFPTDGATPEQLFARAETMRQASLQPETPARGRKRGEPLQKQNRKSLLVL